MPSCAQLRIAIEQIPPQGLQLKGVASIHELAIGENSRISCPQPLHFALNVVLINDDVLAQGRLETMLKCRCDRCLAIYEHHLVTDNICHLIEDPVDKIVDLTERIREDM